MNIRITKVFQDAPYQMLEVAFNRDPRGTAMIAEIAEQYGPVHDSQKDMQGPDDRAYSRGGIRAPASSNPRICRTRCGCRERF